MKRKTIKAVSGIFLTAMALSFFLHSIPLYAAEPENREPARARVKVTKVDSVANVGLSGATFGIYRDEACTDKITDLAETDENGESEQEVAVTQDTAYLKEITAPEGYRDNLEVYPADLTVGQTVSVTIPGEERMGYLEITSKGHVLTGIDTDGEGAKFQYWRNLEREGAVFTVHAGEDIITPYGAVVYRQGDLVAENLETGAAGFVTLKNLHRGTYRITSVHAPYKFYNARQRKTISNHYLDTQTDEWSGGTIFYFDRQRAKVRITKTDQDTASGVEGAVFGLYAAEDIQNEFGDRILEKDTLIEKATTDADGTAAFTEELPVDYGYYVKEEQTPEGYQQNTDRYSFRYDYISDKDAEAEFSHYFTSARITASIQLFRTDMETGQPQGDAALQNAVYGLFARNDILNPARKSETVYKAGEQVGTLATDYNGEAKIENLYMGQYYIKELTPSTGYLPDKKEYDITCGYESGQAIVEKSCNITVQVIKRPFQVIKTASVDEPDKIISRTGFTAYLLSSLKKKEGGEYDLDSAIPVEIGKHGETEIFTDEKGCACSILLPYGTYLIHESTTPPNSHPVKDFTIQVTEHNPDTPHICTVSPEDENILTTVLIKKTDHRDIKPVEGAELQVTDAEGTVVESWTSQNEPHILRNLAAGAQYQLKETLPADGYVTADSITFIPMGTEEPQEIEMQSDVTKIEISRINQDGSIVPGASLSILDKAGNKIQSWISENEAYKIEMLPIGEYILHEESPPESCPPSEDMPFQVLDISTVQKVIMGSKEAPADSPETKNPDEPEAENPDTETYGSKEPDSKEKDVAASSSDKPEKDSDISDSKKPDLEREDSVTPDSRAQNSKNKDSESSTSLKSDLKSPDQEPVLSEKSGQGTIAPNSPKTGDKSAILFWTILLILASCILAGCFIFRFYKNQKNKINLK